MAVRPFCGIYFDRGSDHYFVLGYGQGGEGSYGPVWPPTELSRLRFLKEGRESVTRAIMAANYRAQDKIAPNRSRLREMKMIAAQFGAATDALELVLNDQYFGPDETFHAMRGEVLPLGPDLSDQGFAAEVERAFSRCVCCCSVDLQLTYAPFLDIYLADLADRFYILRWVRLGSGAGGQGPHAPGWPWFVPWGDHIVMTRAEMQAKGAGVIFTELAAFPSWRADQNPNPDPDARVLRKLGLLLMKRVSVVDVPASAEYVRFSGVALGVNLFPYITFKRYPWHYWFNDNKILLPPAVSNTDFFNSLEQAFALCTETDEEL